jgi:ABC-type multidrug transport system permease subunit
MGQISTTMKKTFKEFIRQKVVLFWTIAWPIIWVLIGSFSFTGDAPKEVVPFIRGSITISMITLALMIAGMANIPGNIAEDRERGLLFKLMSMPVSPWKDFIGRFIGMVVFALIALILVLLVGFACGARFAPHSNGVWIAIGMILIIIFTSAGIGMLVGSLIRNIQGAIMTGVGIAVVTAAISGIMAPYYALPSILQKVSRIIPVSTANSSIIYLLAGEELAGYNPLSINQVVLSISVTIVLFAVGLLIYSKLCWKKT